MSPLPTILRRTMPRSEHLRRSNFRGFAIVSPLLFLCCGVAVGDAPLPVYEIDESPGTYLESELPRDIWRYSRDGQLGDMVMLDSEDGELPFRVVVPKAEVRESRDRFSLPFYSVAEGAELSWGGPGNTQVRIDDSAISVTREAGEGVAARSFYLVDLSQIETEVDSLLVGWEGESPDQYLHLQVSATRDLQNWIPIAQHTLVRLEKEGHTLLRDEVPLGLRPRQYNFLRIEFPRDRDVPTLTSIEGVDKSAVVDPLPMQTWQVAGKLARDQVPASRYFTPPDGNRLIAWEYERQDHAPVRQVAVDLGELAYGDFVRLYSRADPRHDWQSVHSGIWFNARVGAEWESSDSIHLHQNTHRYWRLEMSRALQGRAAPALVFEHPRQTLRFIASGNLPYHLALVSERSGNPAAKVFTRLIGEESHQWLPVSLRPLLSPEEAATRRAPGFDWQGLVFWTVLLAAVAVLVGLALRLFRQMEKSV